MKRCKKDYRRSIFSIVFYIINIVIVFYPWIIVGNTKYNIVQLKRKIETIGIDKVVEQSGVTVDNPDFVWFVVRLQIVFYVLFILFCLGYIFSVAIGKNWRLNLVTFYNAVGIMIVNISGYSIASLCTNSVQGTLFPIVSVIITLTELLGSELSEKKTIKK